MMIREKLFWAFSFLFFTFVMLFAVYVGEAGVAAIFGILLGQTMILYQIEQKRRT